MYSDAAAVEDCERAGGEHGTDAVSRVIESGPIPGNVKRLTSPKPRTTQWTPALIKYS